MDRVHEPCPDSTGAGAPADRPASDGALEKMAERLAEGLAYGCFCERWAELDVSDRYALIGACEWLLMRWDLVESAATEYRQDGLPPAPPRQPHK